MRFRLTYWHFDAIISDSKGTPEMNLYSYLEKHGELENASNALAYFADSRPRGGMRHVDVDSDIFKCYKMAINDTTTRIGQYSSRKRQIELHEGLLVEGREEEHRQTLLHEVAHLIQRHVWGGCYGIKSHGREWKMVMGKLGIPANRTHSSDWMKEHTVKKAKLVYGCKKCELEIHAQKPRRKLLQMGVYHRNCGGAFYLKEDRRVAKLWTVAENAPQEMGQRKVNKKVIGQVNIKQASWRNKWLKSGVYDLVRDFKYKSGSHTKGTLSLLIRDQVIRVTVQEGWYEKV